MATLIGAGIALIAALLVQIRTAAAGLRQSRRDAQRDAVAELVGLAEIVSDDVRELRTALIQRDTARATAVWPRYLDDWSRLVGATARVRVLGPKPIPREASELQEWIAGISDHADDLKAHGFRSVSDVEWAEATGGARDAFLSLAVTATSDRLLERRAPQLRSGRAVMPSVRAAAEAAAAQAKAEVETRRSRDREDDAQ